LWRVEERLVGRSGLRVSRLGLGTLTWGRDTDAHEAADQLRAFLDAGGSLVDTAASYGEGAAEELIGSLLDDVVCREDVVLCSKGGVTRRDGARLVDTSRRALLGDLDRSLRRLRTDHLDLWLVHGWSGLVPLEETLAALAEAVHSGRTRYVGVSNYSGWQTAHAATLFGQLAAGHRLVGTQVEYSLVAVGPWRPDGQVPHRDAGRLPRRLPASVGFRGPLSRRRLAPGGGRGGDGGRRPGLLPDRGGPGVAA
jgi:aryl-alcohol dehydrogenase-like predicted oxidoreductase